MTGAWKGFLEKIHGARRLEWLLLLVAVCVLALLFLSTNREASGGAQPTELEARLERVLSAVDGAGDVRAMVTERDGAVLGVVIVAEGANEVRVRLSLAQAARALLDTELSRIEVIEMRRE